MFIENGWTSRDDIKRLGTRAILLNMGYSSRQLDDDLWMEDALLRLQTAPAFEKRQMRMMAQAIGTAFGG